MGAESSPLLRGLNWLLLTSRAGTSLTWIALMV
jgi:hypothetical protein